MSRAMSSFLAIASAAALAACATVDTSRATRAEGVTIQILALNDFHGNIEAPQGQTTWNDHGEIRQAQLGGAARLGSALARIRQDQPHTITVAAGDMIGASPLTSAHFLDEPAILALNLVGLELAAVGNHEFDRGPAELRRMQDGGCEKFTSREPCALDSSFGGASFAFLAANVLDEQGQTLFSGTALRDFGPARIGIIGMTLKETATLVSPAGIAGYRFADEAETANREAARLLSEGADTIVLLLHQGGYVDPAFNVADCPGLSGPVLPILDRLDPAIGLVISGHTHHAYVCNIETANGSSRLLTSAGRYGNFVTDIRVMLDPASERAATFTAVNRPVTVAAGEQDDVAALVARYAEAIEPVASRIAGHIEGSLDPAGRESDTPLGRLIADAQFAATRGQDAGRADFALINSGGIRTRFAPAADGSVTYGQLFALQPFGNTLMVIELTGGQIRDLFEQQFTEGTPGRIRQSLLIPSAGLRFSYDRSRPFGSRILDLALHGAPIEPERLYRVAINNFLASGGDGFDLLTQGKVIFDGGLDLDALEAFIAKGARIDEVARIADLTPAP